MAATFDRPSVTAELAKAVIAAAEQRAQELGQPFVIAVADDSGVLKAFSRMDGAPLLSVQVAQDKAYTAVGFGMPTHGWHGGRSPPPAGGPAGPGGGGRGGRRRGPPAAPESRHCRAGALRAARHPW